MEEKIINNIELTLEEFRVSPLPYDCIEINAAKIEGAITMAYIIDVISREQFREYYGELLKIKMKKFEIGD